MPGGLFLVRIFFSKVHDVFICEHTFDYFYKNMNGKPEEIYARARALPRAGYKPSQKPNSSLPVRINASVAMGRES